MGGAKQSKQGLILKTGLQRENSTIYIKREAVSLRVVTMEKRKRRSDSDLPKTQAKQSLGWKPHILQILGSSKLKQSRCRRSARRG